MFNFIQNLFAETTITEISLGRPEITENENSWDEVPAHIMFDIVEEETETYEA